MDMGHVAIFVGFNSAGPEAAAHYAKEADLRKPT
jgi:hypothetical protein